MGNTLVFHATTCLITLMTTECVELQVQLFTDVLMLQLQKLCHLCLLFICYSVFETTLVHLSALDMLCYTCCKSSERKQLLLKIKIV